MFGIQALHYAEAEADGIVGFDGAAPVRTQGANGAETNAAAASILDEGGRRIETHGLIVEEAGVELRGAMDFEPGTSVGEESEADGVGFGKAVQGEGTDRFEDVVGGFGIDF